MVQGMFFLPRTRSLLASGPSDVGLKQLQGQQPEIIHTPGDEKHQVWGLCKQEHSWRRTLLPGCQTKSPKSWRAGWEQGHQSGSAEQDKRSGGHFRH